MSAPRLTLEGARTLLAELVRDSAPRALRPGPIAFGDPVFGVRPSQGMIDAAGQAWEVTHRWSAAALPDEQLRRLGCYVAQQQAAGYELARAAQGGVQLLLERMRNGTALQPWDGLELLGAWRDQSAAGCPWQFWGRARWTYPGGRFDGETLAGEIVALYVRWRWDHIMDPAFPRARELWTGRVYRFDPGATGLDASVSCPRSPQLLPTVHPDDVQRVEIVPELLGAFGMPAPAEAGHLEQQDAAAREDLCRRADRWLREHGANAARWEPGVEAKRAEGGQ